MKKKIFIQYNCIAHYRTRIFELLSSNEEIEFTIIADTDPDIPFLKTFDKNDQRFIRQRYSKIYKIKIPFIPDVYFQPRTIWLIIKEKPDCVISLGTIYSLTSWLVLMTTKILNIPSIIWGHGLLENEVGAKWLIRKFFYSFADAHLLYGHYAKDLLIKKGIKASQLFVVYNSLDYDKQLAVYKNLKKQNIEEFRNKLGIGKESRVVIFTGRLQPVKKLDMLVTATANLNNKNKGIHVIFIGDGEQKVDLETLASQRNISDKVHFLGASYDEDFIGLAFGASDLCVVPSGAGLTIMHSLVYGTPVLLHDKKSDHFPEWEAVEEGVTGFYYKYGDLDDLIDKIDQALFPENQKITMEDQCVKVISKKYNPYTQEKIFIDASKHVMK
jgi:glycosyltransferase involved in cell wall biosynthesis